MKTQQKPPGLAKLCRTRQVLRKGKELLQKEKWIKGSFRVGKDEEGQYHKMCAIGAIQEARARLKKNGLLLPGADGAAMELKMAARQARPDRFWDSVPEFNDNRDTQKADVISAFSIAIKGVEKKIEEVGG